MYSKICRARNKRRNLRKDAEWLRDLRLRYIWRCRQAIMLDRYGDVLKFCARQLIVHEVRGDLSMNNACYAILRQIWRFDKRANLSWHQWTQKNGWTCRPWGRRGIK